MLQLEVPIKSIWQRSRGKPADRLTMSPRSSRTGRLVLVFAAVGLLSAGCQSVSSQTPAVSTTPVTPVTIAPQRNWSDAVLYFVLVDRYADGDASNNANYQPQNPGGWHGGDLKGLAAQLDEIAELGATAIWINPLQEQINIGLPVDAVREAGVDQWFEHRGFHGYWIEDFEALDPHFGSEADLKALVDAAHARGIRVLLDVVYNHSGYGSKYEVDPRYRGWVRHQEPDCERDPIRCRVGGLPDFVTEQAEVATYLMDANIGLAKRTGVDGFRLDTVKHLDHDFWRAHRARTRAELGPDFFLLAEVWGGSSEILDEWFEGDEVDAGFDFSFRGSCQDFVAGRMRAVAYSAYLERRHRVRESYHLAHYLSSHDEPMQLHEMDGDRQRFRLCVAAQMTTLGIPVIYYGEEVAREGSVWPTNRNDMPWGARRIAPGAGKPRDEALRNWYRTLIALRRARPALSRGSYSRLHADGDLLVFRKDDATTGDAAVVAINRAEVGAAISVPAPPGWRSAMDAITNDPAVLSTEGLDVRVPPLGVRVYVAGGGSS